MQRISANLAFLTIIGLTACDPGAFLNFSSKNQTGFRLSSGSADHESTLGNSARGNLTNDIQQGLEGFNKVGNKSSTKQARATIYYIPDEKNFPGAKTSTIYDRNGRVLAKVSSSFKSALAMQGSGILSDGRTVNYASKGRYFVTPHKYGVGSSAELPLKPFRSLAVDLGYWRRAGYSIKNGDKVYIKATDGMKIPGSNQIHNGVWEVADKGGAIKGNRIDMFFGTMHWRDAMEYLGNSSNFVPSFASHDDAGDIGNKNSSIGINFMI